jgi:hypothetical protein
VASPAALPDAGSTPAASTITVALLRSGSGFATGDRLAKPGSTDRLIPRSLPLGLTRTFDAAVTALPSTSGDCVATFSVVSGEGTAHRRARTLEREPAALFHVGGTNAEPPMLAIQELSGRAPAPRAAAWSRSRAAAVVITIT